MDAIDPQVAAPRSRAWIGRAAFEAALIVLGLVGALVIDEWRDTRARDVRVRAALTSIRAELAANYGAVAAAIANHENVMAKLRESARSGLIYQGGIMNAPPFSSVAWEAARDAAITNDIDHATLMTLGHAYTALSGTTREREVFLNYLYTNNTRNLRENPLGLAGWLNDLTTHAHQAQVHVGAALTALDSAGPASPR